MYNNSHIYFFKGVSTSFGPNFKGKFEVLITNFTCGNTKGDKDEKDDGFTDRPDRCHKCTCTICREYCAKEVEKARAKTAKKKAANARRKEEKKVTKRARGTSAPGDRLARLDAELATLKAEKREEPKKW
jgi:hypothetical protein